MFKRLLFVLCLPLLLIIGSLGLFYCSLILVLGIFIWILFGHNRTEKIMGYAFDINPFFKLLSYFIDYVNSFYK